MLIRQICTQRVNWEQALQLEDITHVLDFGPGGVSGIGSLTERICKGKGIQVILAGILDVPNGDLLAKLQNTQEELRKLKAEHEELHLSLAEERLANHELEAKIKDLNSKAHPTLTQAVASPNL